MMTSNRAQSATVRGAGTRAHSTLVNTVFSPLIEVQIDVLSSQTPSETVPITMSTTAIEVIGLLIEKHKAGHLSHSPDFYLKECTYSESGIYKRTIENSERLMQILNKQQQGNHTVFILCRKEKIVEAIKQNVCDDSDPQFFSPPHVVEVSDRNYRRRNSLPSFICFNYYGEQDSVTSVPSNNQSNRIEEGSNKYRRKSDGEDEATVQKTIVSTRSVRVQANRGMSEIMNRVVQETDQIRYTKWESSSDEPVSRSPPLPHHHSPEKSSFKIRPLVCSPCLSPQKLYPTFVFTPSDRVGKGTAGTILAPPPHFSLDTEENGCSPSNGIMEERKEAESGNEDNLVSSERDTDPSITRDTDPSITEEDEALKRVATVQEKVQTIHTAVAGPTHSKKSVRHILRTPSPLDVEAKAQPMEIVVVKEDIVSDTKHALVKRERWVSPPPGTPENKSEQPNAENTNFRADDSKSTANNSASSTATESDASLKQEQSARHQRRDVDVSESFQSEMNLFDSFTSILSPLFDEDKTSSSPDGFQTESFCLVSPNRTKTMIEEASAHSRRRRGGMSKSSKTVSESTLSIRSADDERLMTHQSSSPLINLISPSRHEKMIRQASEHIVKTRLRRKSEQLEAESRLDTVREQLDLSSPIPQSKEQQREDANQSLNVRKETSSSCSNNKRDCVQSETVASSPDRGEGGSGGGCGGDKDPPTGSTELKRHHSERIQRRRLPSLFSWRSFRGHQRSRRSKQNNSKSQS